MRRMILTLALVALAAPSWAADTYVRVRTHTDALNVMGREVPASDIESEIWISATKMATVSKETSFIIDLDRNVVVLVNHGTRSYVEAGLPLDFAKLLPPEMSAMAGMMQLSATVKPTGEQKKIGQWDCLGYDATLTMMGMGMNIKIWATTQVPFDLASFQAKMMPAIIQGQMRLNQASVSEFAKIKGYQVATETTGEAMGARVHSTTEVVEMVAKPAPAGAYAPPQGYTKKATLGIEDLQRR